MEILPDRCTMIAKKELIYAGTVGIVCWLGGIVFINRKKTSDAKSVMVDAAETMVEEQVSLPHSERWRVIYLCIIHSGDDSIPVPLLTCWTLNCTDSFVGVPRGYAEPEWWPAPLQKGSLPPGSAGTGLSPKPPFHFYLCVTYFMRIKSPFTHRYILFIQ